MTEGGITEHLQRFLDEKSALYPIQPGLGTETELLAVVDDLHRQLDKGGSALLGLSAAFDTVDLSILFNCLASLGVCGATLAWFRSFLEGHHWSVAVGDECSTSVGFCKV